VSGTPRPAIQNVVAVLWPSFLTAGIATIVAFTFFDPEEALIGTPLEGVPRLGAYTIGFFFYWLLTAASSFLTCYFQRPPSDFNRSR
jgi:hypothetical protein